MKRINTSIILLILVLLNSCYTVVNKEIISKYIETHQTTNSIFPPSSIINEELIGSWEKTFIINDLGIGRQVLHFSKDGIVDYSNYHKNYYGDYFQGEYRSLSDTIYLKVNTQFEVEKLTFMIKDNHLYLQNVESPSPDQHHSIEGGGGFIYRGE